MKQKHINTDSISAIIADLPLHLQQEVTDFIAFICSRHGVENNVGEEKNDMSLYQLQRAWGDEDEGLI
ncbi:MAG: hypothetical protein ACN2B6_06185 [Rickettsiales bacterium]